MSDFKTAFEKVKDTKPFPMKKMGQFGLRYSVIPKEECDRLILFLDADSHTALAAKGLQYKLTVDEMVRRAIWLLLSEPG